MVGPASRRAELLVLLLLVVDLGMLAALRAAAMERRNFGAPLAAYEMSSTELPQRERVLYQALAGSVSDIAYLLQADNAWPEAEELSATAVPPFDPRLLPPALRDLDAETGSTGGAWADYVFRPMPGDPSIGSSADRSEWPAYLLRVIDRDAPIDPLRHPHPHLPRNPEAGRFFGQIWRHPDPEAASSSLDLRSRGWSWVIPGTSTEDP